MSKAGFTVPDEIEAVTYPNQSGLYQSDIEVLAAAAAQESGVIMGCQVTAQGSPNATVAVAAGFVRIDGGRFAVSAFAALAVSNAHASLDRIDLVVADHNDVVSVLTGTAASSPIAPDLSAGQTVLAQIYRPAAATTVTTAMIVDKRSLLTWTNSLYDHRLVFGPELQWWRGALAKVLAKTGKARVWVVGDSMFEGYGPSTVALRPIEQVRQYLQALWRAGGDGFVPPQHAGGIANEWTVAGSPDMTDYGFGIGRHGVYLNAAGQSFTITKTCDRFKLLYTSGSTGYLSVTIDGGAATLIDTNSASGKSGRVWDSGALTLGSHTIVVSANSTRATANGYTTGTYVAFFDGAIFYNSDYTVGVEVLNSAHSGYQATAFNGSVAANAEWAEAADTMPPDLVIVEFGLNELGNGGISQATYKQALIDIVANLKTKGGYSYNPSVVLVPLWARGDATSGTQSDGTWTNGQTAFRSENGHLKAGDSGKGISGTGIPGGATLTVIDRWSGTLSAAATASSGTGVGIYTIGARTAKFTDVEWAPFRKTMYDLAKEQGWAVWDMYNIFGYIGADTQALTVDFIHPSDIGASQIAYELATMLMGGPPAPGMQATGVINGKGWIYVGTADNTTTGKAPGANRKILQADSAQTDGLLWADNESVINFSYAGNLVAGTTGKSRWYADKAYTIKSARASVNTAPTGTTAIVDINKNGTTIFTTQSRRPAIAISGFTATPSGAIEVTTLAAGDYITVDIDQVGSTIAGADLTVQIVLVEA